MAKTALSKDKIISNTRSFFKTNTFASKAEFWNSIDPASPDGDTFRDYDKAIRSGKRGMEKQELGLGIVVCERKGWADDPRLWNQEGDTKKVRAARLKTVLLTFFFGDFVGLTQDDWNRLTVAEAVRISQAKWTPKQLDLFEEKLRRMSVQEAIDASFGAV